MKIHRKICIASFFLYLALLCDAHPFIFTSTSASSQNDKQNKSLDYTNDTSLKMGDDVHSQKRSKVPQNEKFYRKMKRQDEKENDNENENASSPTESPSDADSDAANADNSPTEDILPLSLQIPNVPGDEESEEPTKAPPKASGRKNKKTTNEEHEEKEDEKKWKMFKPLSEGEMDEEDEAANLVETQTIPPVRFRYMDESDGLNSPTLKHFTLYSGSFYPPFSYYGFNPPPKWHEVPIEYFTRPPRNMFDPEDLKKHKSAMLMCSTKVTIDIRKCYDMIANECVSDMPSPINIIPEKAEEDLDMTAFEFIHFDTFFGFTMFVPEDGTDLLFMTFIPPKQLESKIPAVSRGSVKNQDLYLDRISFHFGKDPNHGSEHAINGTHFGMEIQLYFVPEPSKGTYWEFLAKYNMKIGNPPQAGNTVHVLSVMVQVGRPGAKKPEDPGAKFNNRFEIISLAAMMFWESENLGKYRAVQMPQKLISLEDFLGVPYAHQFYTYEGSLTHPPCTPHVRWTIFEEPIWIRYEHWLRFSIVHSEFSDENFLGGNYRPLRDISVRVDIPTYIEMRRLQGLKAPEQKELDTIAETNLKNATKSELYVIRKYNDYQMYFAQNVQKRHIVEAGQANDEEDYYDSVEEEEESSANSQYFHKLLIIKSVACFIISKVIV